NDSIIKILLFYLIFYGCLAGIFIGTIQALLLTLSNYKPTYQDRVAPPETFWFPFPDLCLDTILSLSSTTIPSISWLGFCSDMHCQLCLSVPVELPESYRDRGQLESDVGVRKACRFKRTWLGPCAGLDGHDESFGFKDGKPCLIAKLNRIVHLTWDWETYHEHIDSIPNGMGFPLQYYPYYGKLLHPQYLQPLVAIQFTNLTFNEELRLECKVYGANIDYSEKDRYQGRFDVKFTIASS
uniref:Sodium/potassium-transporting ATPase subunit beta n=1 Tax=Hucho hucho TaxID=62062 RepID=A0A4W5PY02_9TELE